MDISNINNILIYDENIEFKYNIIKNEEINKYECKFNDSCNYKSIELSIIKKHYNQVHLDIRPFKCDECDEKFKRKAHLEQHIEDVHKKIRNYKCTYEKCNLEFKRDEHLKNHIKGVHEQIKDLICDICNLGFSQQGHLNIHKKIHNPQFICDFKDCNEKYISERQLNIHKRIHDPNPRFVCEHCGKNNFNDRGQLNIHIRTHTGEKPYICNYENCTSKFTSKTELNKHMNVHSNKYNFSCDYTDCNKLFKTKSGLYHHKLKHENNKNIFCQYEDCDYSCYDKVLLNSHIKIHSDERNYKCNFEDCNSEFKHLNTLKDHIKMHENKREFKCNYENCSSTFNTYCGLREHLMRHNNIKPYKCQYLDCTYESVSSGTINAHIKCVHINAREFKCEIDNCGYDFNLYSVLKKHMNEYHSEKAIQNKKKQETKIAKLLDKYNINYKREHQINFQCLDNINKNFARIDFLILKDSGVIFLEIDENQHRFGEYSILCDMSRMTYIIEALMLDGNTLPILFIRYNPNAIKVDGVNKLITKSTRQNKLIEFINNYQFNNEIPLQIQYMYYNITNSKLEIHNDPDYDDNIIETCIEPIY